MASGRLELPPFAYQTNTLTQLSYKASFKLQILTHTIVSDFSIEKTAFFSATIFIIILWEYNAKNFFLCTLDFRPRWSMQRKEKFQQKFFFEKKKLLQEKNKRLKCEGRLELPSYVLQTYALNQLCYSLIFHKSKAIHLKKKIFF